MTNPFHLGNILSPALEGIIRAVSDRTGLTEARREERAHQTLIRIMAFMPRDVIDLTLAGQTVLFTELLADGGRDVLRGMVDTAKQRSISGLVNMGRLVQGHVDRLEKRGLRPHQTDLTSEIEETETETERPAAAPSPPADPAPRGAESSPDATVDETSGTEPAAEASWLDAPFEEWVLETPADMAARPEIAATAADVAAPEKAAAAVDVAATPEKAAADKAASDRLLATGAGQFGEKPAGALADKSRYMGDPSLPRQPPGYLPARALLDAGAGAAD